MLRQQGFPVPELCQEPVVLIGPDLAKRLFQDIAKISCPPELVRVNVPQVVDTGDAPPGAVAAVLTQQSLDIVSALGRVFTSPHGENWAICVVVHGQDFKSEAGLVRLDSALENELNGLAPPVVVQIKRKELLAAAGVREVIYADTRDAFFFRKIEQTRQIMDVLLRHRESKADAHVGRRGVTSPFKSVLERTFRPSELVVGLLKTVQAYSSPDHTRVGQRARHLRRHEHAV